MSTVRRQQRLLPGRLRCFLGLYLCLAQVSGWREASKLHPLRSAQDKAKTFKDKHQPLTKY